MRKSWLIIGLFLAGCSGSSLQLEPGAYSGMGRQYVLDIRKDSTFKLVNVQGEGTEGTWSIEDGDFIMKSANGTVDKMVLNHVSRDSLNLGFQDGLYDVGFVKNRGPKYLTDSTFLMNFILTAGKMRYNSFFNADPYEVHTIEFMDDGTYLFDQYFVFKWEVKNFNEGVYMLMIHNERKVPFMMTTCSKKHVDFKTYSLEKGELISTTIKKDRDLDMGLQNTVTGILQGDWVVTKDEHGVFSVPNAEIRFDSLGKYQFIEGETRHAGDWKLNPSADHIIFNPDIEPFVFHIQHFSNDHMIINRLEYQSQLLETFEITRKK